MDPQVSAQFRMERGPDEVALSREDNPVLVPREGRAIPPRPQDRRGADEDAVEWRVESRDLKVRLERFALTSECVAVDGHIHEPEESGLGLLCLATGVFRHED